MGDLRQEGVIEHVAANVDNLGDQEEAEGSEDVARLAEVEQYGEQGARIGTGQQETLLGSRHIGDGAQGWGHQKGQKSGQARGEPPQGCGPVDGVSESDAFGSHHRLGKIGGQHPHGDGGGVGRVGPVVHAPAKVAPAVAGFGHEGCPG